MTGSLKVYKKCGEMLSVRKLSVQVSFRADDDGIILLDVCESFLN